MNRRDKLIIELLDELEDKERTISYLRKKNREQEEKLSRFIEVTDGGSRYFVLNEAEKESE